ncbi:hypothetical protein BST95_12840 [Halioglobus japonicus]|uniref:TetR/AcrR family transcriptional regulator n=1 Tax=Halioglobus japonicus TaxID=930805 RepID=A0AAP8MHM9_9GAMM|nr:TetR family transcriptional regulator [Halioglobus japonicus]AQA18997.1 hypothetical protein BST95_12840 [Halioglobus japonicus]PLW87988.1 TetR/AcrR family transcriptional regulator [Halioglobus japonicus]GHD20361.1 hypothetical protein GCM10007052_29780 [Halioglobus japonicus]
MEKREQNNARTRQRLLEAAVSLYGSRSIDSVSLREIALAGGQKNPNALQYHFGDRDGLLQAIVDFHASGIGARRQAYFERAGSGEWPPAEAVSRCLIMPIIEYVEANAAGLDFVNIVSQLATSNHGVYGLGSPAAVSFPRPAALAELFDAAFAGLPPEQIQQRIYLIVDTAFHAIANIFKASRELPAQSPLADRHALCEQLLAMVHAFIVTPAISGADAK